MDKKTAQDYITHPKKPDEAALAELSIPYHVAKAEVREECNEIVEGSDEVVR